MDNLPVYQQLLETIRGELTGPGYSPGSRFLTERQLADRYGVSRATANKVLSALVSESALEFRRGVGTFVAARNLDYNLRALVSFTEEARAAGMRPSTVVLRFEKLSAGQVPDDTRAHLRLPLNDLVFYLERLRLADDQPVILEKRYIVAAHCPRLTAADAARSLYQVWRKKFGLNVEGADQTIRAVSLHGEDAQRLALPDGAAGMLVRSIGFLAGDTPLWFERTLYRGDAYEFRNRLSGIQSARHAGGRFLAPTLREDR